MDSFLLCYAPKPEGSAQIITDRPDQTESSSTVEKGALQIEARFQIGFEGDHSNVIAQSLVPTTLFRQGISERFELRILSQIEQIRFQEKIIANQKENCCSQVCIWPNCGGSKQWNE